MYLHFKEFSDMEQLVDIQLRERKDVSKVCRSEYHAAAGMTVWA